MNNGSAARRQLLDPNPLIIEAAALAMLGAEDQVILRFDLADGVMVSVDPVQIQQVVINLIRNAGRSRAGSTPAGNPGLHPRDGGRRRNMCRG